MAIPDGNFEELLLPHLNAAYNLARWLLRNEYDAEDVVQEAYLRAFRFFGDFRGGDARAWLLRIVRNACYSLLQKNRSHELTTTFDEETHGETHGSNPEALVSRNEDSRFLRTVLEELPLNAREVLVLRELEGCSYAEIAEVTNVPIGTVMSTLYRARGRLRQLVNDRNGKERSAAALAGHS